MARARSLAPRCPPSSGTATLPSSASGNDRRLRALVGEQRGEGAHQDAGGADADDRPALRRRDRADARRCQRIVTSTPVARVREPMQFARLANAGARRRASTAPARVSATMTGRHRQASPPAMDQDQSRNTARSAGSTSASATIALAGHARALDIARVVGETQFRRGGRAHASKCRPSLTMRHAVGGVDAARELGRRAGSRG